MTAIVLEVERREYSRCVLDARAELRLGSRVLACRVKDISLQGLLVCTTASTTAAGEREPCTVTVHLDAGPTTIVMQGAIAHVRDGEIGVACREMDLDSFAHLRRLLELNLAEEKLVRGELATLTSRPRR